MPVNSNSSVFCSCSIFKEYDEFIEVFLYVLEDFALIASVLAITSNLLTILVLRRMQSRSSSENLLLAIAAADLVLATVFLARYVYASFGMIAVTGEISFFRISIFYLWHVSHAISISLTLVLAARRYIAIEHAHVYEQVCSRQRTNRILLAVCIFSAVLLLPILFYKFDPEDENRNIHRRCEIDMTKEVLYASIIMATTRLPKFYALKIVYWMYVFVFLLASPIFLTGLSFESCRALRRKVASTPTPSSTLVRACEKTKVILIISMLVVVRDLPLGLLSSFYLFSLPPPACLTMLRLLTVVLTIVLSAMNFTVLYYTNQTFKKAVPHFKSFFSNFKASENDV